MNELAWDPAPRFAPTKFDSDPIRTVPGRAVTVWGNACPGACPPAQQATTIPLKPDSGWGVKRHESVFLHDDYENLLYGDSDIMTLSPDHQNDRQHSGNNMSNPRWAPIRFSSSHEFMWQQSPYSGWKYLNSSCPYRSNNFLSLNCFFKHQESDLKFIYGFGNKQHQVTDKVAIKLNING